MKYNFKATNLFAKEYKTLLKKYPSLKNDIENLKNEIIKKGILGNSLGAGFSKIRLKIKSKNTGASGGARIISHELLVSIDETDITFVSIFDKGQYKNINLEILRKNIGI